MSHLRGRNAAHSDDAVAAKAQRQCFPHLSKRHLQARQHRVYSDATDGQAGRVTKQDGMCRAWLLPERRMRLELSTCSRRTKRLLASGSSGWRSRAATARVASSGVSNSTKACMCHATL